MDRQALILAAQVSEEIKKSRPAGSAAAGAPLK
jgi:hypothetical protein